jgi:uncharacterized membrane protein
MYDLDALAIESSRKLIWSIFGVGVLMIGCGVAAFVAYNWEAMPDGLKIGLVTGLMLAAHIGGFRLWFAGNWPRLGHALVLLGTLIFYADIGLLAQIYNISSDGRSSYMALAIGAGAIVLAVESTPNFLVASLAALAWGTCWPFGRDEAVGIMTVLFPPLYLALVAGHVARTRSIFSLLAGYGVTAFLVCAVMDRYLEIDQYTSSFLLIFAMLAPIVASLLDRSGERHPLSPPLFWLGLLLGAATLFVLAFQDPAADLARDYGAGRVGSGAIAVHLAVGALAILLVGAREWRFFGSRAGLDQAAESPMVVVLPCALALNLQYADTLMVVFANLALVAWSLLALATGVAAARNGRFWFGLITINALVLARFFEYDTNLLVKSAAFIGAGIVTIAGGVWFEKRKRRVV